MQQPDIRLGRGSFVVVCGLVAEGRIASGLGNVHVIVGGGDQPKLSAALAITAPTARGFLSFGVAGGLAPGLRAGDVRIAERVFAPDGETYSADAQWRDALAARLAVPLATVAGVDAPLADVAGKTALHRATGAALVDMETHLVAAAARAASRPFAAIRVVTDAADHALPHAATVGMRADGAVDYAAILKSLMHNPRQIPALIRTGRDAKAAFAALFRCRQLLGPGVACLDL